MGHKYIRQQEPKQLTKRPRPIGRQLNSTARSKPAFSQDIGVLTDTNQIPTYFLIYGNYYYNRRHNVITVTYYRYGIIHSKFYHFITSYDYDNLLFSLHRNLQLTSGASPQRTWPQVIFQRNALCHPRYFEMDPADELEYQTNFEWLCHLPYLILYLPCKNQLPSISRALKKSVQDFTRRGFHFR